MAWYRLFNSRQWLADRETVYAVNQGLIKLGLLDAYHPTWRNTPLGRELNLDLFEAIIGLWDAWEVPWILQDHRFIDEIEVDSLYAQMHRRGNPESVLLRYVRQAYLDHGKANKFLH
jgi:hypothetical protein